MKIAVFGTGKYYQKYRPYLDNCDIQYLLDNDKKNRERKSTA